MARSRLPLCIAGTVWSPQGKIITQPVLIVVLLVCRRLGLSWPCARVVHGRCGGWLGGCFGRVEGLRYASYRGTWASSEPRAFGSTLVVCLG